MHLALKPLKMLTLVLMMRAVRRIRVIIRFLLPFTLLVLSFLDLLLRLLIVDLIFLILVFYLRSEFSTFCLFQHGLIHSLSLSLDAI